MRYNVFFAAGATQKNIFTSIPNVRAVMRFLIFQKHEQKKKAPRDRSHERPSQKPI
jgi:hypothetical protein